ncbi:MAG: cyclic nucleotide-binding domain-containing protein [Bdellovibrionales bacterium]|nr:cyclic nucleotide-binding domain-containing protein [Bdellovibrionales bacterium]
MRENNTDKDSTQNYFWGYLNSFTKNSTEEDHIAFLKSMPFFHKLSTRQIKVISNYIHERVYEENEYFFELDHPGAALFIIKSGQVDIEIPNDARDGFTVVAQLSKGTFLGELALLDNSPRTASAKATKRTVALSLFRDDLTQLMKLEPEIAAEIYKALATLVGKRLVATTKLINELKAKK